MKILCLHGNGMSGAVFEMQTLSFRKLLGDEHEYVFLDGPLESDCVLGLEKVFKGPYYRWNVTITPPEILAAHDYIRNVIDEEGPFDGVMGFSQGSALAASLLLQHEIDHPKEPPPFKFAILFSCFLMVSPDEKFAKKMYEVAQKKHMDAALKGLKAGEKQSAEVTEEGADEDEMEIDLNESKKGKEIKIPKHRLELLRASKRDALVAEIVDAVASSARSGRQFHGSVATDLPTTIDDGDIDSFPRVFHPLMLTERVKIPTAHIVGRKDPFNKQTNIAKRLFNKESMRSFDHSGGHNVPMVEMEIKAAVAAAQWVIQRSQIPSSRGFHLQRRER